MKKYVAVKSFKSAIRNSYNVGSLKIYKVDDIPEDIIRHMDICIFAEHDNIDLLSILVLQRKKYYFESFFNDQPFVPYRKQLLTTTLERIRIISEYKVIVNNINKKLSRLMLKYPEEFI